VLFVLPPEEAAIFSSFLFFVLVVARGDGNPLAVFVEACLYVFYFFILCCISVASALLAILFDLIHMDK